MDVTSSQPEKRDQLSRKRQRKNARNKIIALGMALLLSGILIGAGGMFFWGRKLVLQNIRRGASLSSISQRLEETLDLNSAQKQKVEAILTTHMPKMREIRRSKYQEIRQEIEAMKGEIESTLDERQMQIWEEQVDQIMFFRRYNRRRPHRPSSSPDANHRHMTPPRNPGPGMGSPSS